LPRLACAVFDIDHTDFITDSYGRHRRSNLQCVADRSRHPFPTRTACSISRGACLQRAAEITEERSKGAREFLPGCLTRPFDVDTHGSLRLIKRRSFLLPPRRLIVRTELVAEAEAAAQGSDSSGLTIPPSPHRGNESESPRRVGMSTGCSPHSMRRVRPLLSAKLTLRTRHAGVEGH